MLFTVMFRSTESFAVRIDGNHLGLNWLDMVREKLELPYLPAQRVLEHAQPLRLDPEVEVSEDVARASGQFTDRSRRFVNVPAGALNRFAVMIPHCKRTDTGEIIQVGARYQMDDAAIIAAWTAAGYPVEWTP